MLCDQLTVLRLPQWWSARVVPLASTGSLCRLRSRNQTPGRGGQVLLLLLWWEELLLLLLGVWEVELRNWYIVIVIIEFVNYSLSHVFFSMVMSSTAKPPSLPLPITACMISVTAKLSCFPCQTKMCIILIRKITFNNLPHTGLVLRSRHQTRDCFGWLQIATISFDLGLGLIYQKFLPSILTVSQH